MFRRNFVSWRHLSNLQPYTWNKMCTLAANAPHVVWLLCVFKVISIENPEDWQYSGDWISCRRKIQEGNKSLIFKIIRIFICKVVSISRELALYVLTVCNVLVLHIKALCVSTPWHLADWLFLKITTVRSFQTSITAYQLKRRIISEDLNVYFRFFWGLLSIFYTK